MGGATMTILPPTNGTETEEDLFVAPLLADVLLGFLEEP